MGISLDIPMGETTPRRMLTVFRRVCHSIIDAPPLHMPRNIDGRFPCAPGCGACLRQLVPISQFDCPELNNWVPLRLALHEADGVRHVETLRPGEEVAMEILRRVISGDQ